MTLQKERSINAEPEGQSKQFQVLLEIAFSGSAQFLLPARHTGSCEKLGQFMKIRHMRTSWKNISDIFSNLQGTNTWLSNKSQ
ncbi:MAG: hypothetical protein HQM08_07910 [Candidatus Riflebacteria bacterium]|nr:hypothetical protein [Candidatus Riflebacteria bacterium]